MARSIWRLVCWCISLFGGGGGLVFGWLCFGGREGREGGEGDGEGREEEGDYVRDGGRVVGCMQRRKGG